MFMLHAKKNNLAFKIHYFIHVRATCSSKRKIQWRENYLGFPHQIWPIGGSHQTGRGAIRPLTKNNNIKRQIHNDLHCEMNFFDLSRAPVDGQ